MFIRTPLPQHPGNLKALTALRFWAALWVVLFHMLQANLNESSLFDRVVSRGALGVDLFFILSGFILMHVYAHQFSDGKFSYGEFLRNRFARIYPLHLFMILIMVVAYTMAGQLGLIRDAEGMNWSHLPWHFLALHAWGFTDGHSWNFPSWSISAEFFAYLIFPFYLLSFQRLRPFVLLAIAIISFSLFNIYLASINVHISQLMFNFGISRIFFEFLLGVGLYAVITQIRLERGVSTFFAAAMLIVVFVFCRLGVSDALGSGPIDHPLAA